MKEKREKDFPKSFFYLFQNPAYTNKKKRKLFMVKKRNKFFWQKKSDKKTE